MRLSELLLYLLLLGGVVLFNVLRQLLSRRRGAPGGQRSPPAANPPVQLPRAPSTKEFWGRTPAAPAQQPALEELPPPGRPDSAERPGILRAAGHRGTAREAAAALSGSKRGLRQAMVALAVLGPCRALSPYEEPGRSP